MKYTMYGVVFLFLTSCVVLRSQEKSLVNKSFEDNTFARIRDGNIIYLMDSISFKRNIEKGLFGDSKRKISFDKLKIIRGYTLGDEKKEYYYVLLIDFNNNLRVAKWLMRDGYNLYLSNSGDDDFEKVFLTCFGVDNCYPNVFMIEQKRFWGCGDDISCILEPARDSSCKSYQTILIEE